METIQENDLELNKFKLEIKGLSGKNSKNKYLSDSETNVQMYMNKK